MASIELRPRIIEKIWGRHRLGLSFADIDASREPVGEIWFEPPGGEWPELLVKYLFTSAKLSVQVHPGDAQAQARGHARGKEECWLILNAEPGAAIGIGLTQTIDAEALRAAALDGSIEHMLDWKPARPGDVFYLPAGTIHAIGAGVTLLEVQQNIDLTYRLYDYGRPRDLHLDDAVNVANPAPWQPPEAGGEMGAGRTVLASGRKFVLEQWSGDHKGVLGKSGPFWLVPLKGSGTVDGKAIEPGSVWHVTDTAKLEHSGTLLIAYAGAEIRRDLLAAD